MGGSLKDGLDPVKAAQIDTIISVLGSCAVRLNNQSKFVQEESKAIRNLASEYQKQGKSNHALDKSLSAMANTQTDSELYEAASQTLSAMSDIGSVAGKNFIRKIICAI